MLERKEQIKLIKYEIEHLRYFRSLEDQLIKIFGVVDFVPNVPCQNYEIFSMILDDLGVPPDKGYPGRDVYLDMYYDVWTCNDWDKNKNKRVDYLINDVLRILKGSKNEKKTGICK